MLLNKHIYRSSLGFSVFAVLLSFVLSTSSFLSISLRILPLTTAAPCGDFVLQDETLPQLAKYISGGVHNIHTSARVKPSSNLFFKKVYGTVQQMDAGLLQSLRGTYNKSLAYIVKPGYYLFLFRYTLF